MSTERGETVLLDFETPIVELEIRIQKLRALLPQAPDLEEEVVRLETQVARLQRETFSQLSRWQIVQLARHPRRPTTLDYVERLFPDFMELHGDRVSGDDSAMIGGPATLDGVHVMVVAHARGRTPDEEQRRNFGMARPSGFRKAARLVRLADRLRLPVLSLLDTPGAYPGAEAEEHGQAPAIASAIEAFSETRTPIVACVLGEGGSGGALALSVSDRLLMQEYSVFPVISPEACSSILYRDGAHAEQMADALRLTARDLEELKLVDEVVPEPIGGAHRDPARAAELVGTALSRALRALMQQPEADRLDARYRRVRSYGSVGLVHVSPGVSA
jgi:acetyl-CoA carboxylase carboxyl transferase subunit alpha